MPDSLTLRAVTKRYGQQAPVIQDLDHAFLPGTATGLVGPNGSGKTTLLRMLCALSSPTTGRITYGDTDIHAAPHAYLRHVGIAHAATELPQYLSATELLTWILRERGRWTDDDGGPDRVAAVLDDLLLDERRAQLIGTYSSGMAQKTQIAAALVHDPAVLLMDEPFRSLDAATTERLQTRLRRFVEDGGLLVIASHLGGPLDAVADEVLSLGEEEFVDGGL